MCIRDRAGTYLRTQPDAAAASALLTGLEMYSTLEKLHLDAAEVPAAQAEPLSQVERCV